MGYQSKVLSENSVGKRVKTHTKIKTEKIEKPLAIQS